MIPRGWRQSGSVFAALAGAILVCGCGTLDPDLLSKADLVEAVLSDPRAAEVVSTELLRDMDNWHHEPFTESPIFFLPLRTDHKLYRIWLTRSLPPDAIIVAISRSTGKALVLSNSPGNFARLLELEGIEVRSEEQAARLAREFIRLTERPMRELWLVQFPDDVPYNDPAHPWLDPPRREDVARTVHPIRARRMAPNAYEVTCFVLTDSGLYRRLIKISGSGEWSHSDEPVEFDQQAESGAIHDQSPVK